VFENDVRCGRTVIDAVSPHHKVTLLEAEYAGKDHLPQLIHPVLIPYEVAYPTMPCRIFWTIPMSFVINVTLFAWIASW
jgi:hypothetical protein